MLLIPSNISWLFRITVMLILITLYTLTTFFLDKRSQKFNCPYQFNFLESLIIGFTGLAVVEDIYFIGIGAHLLMLTFSLPIHATITLYSLFSLVLIVGICTILYFNGTAREAYATNDFITFGLFIFDALVKTMTLFTILTCTWFNVTVLPINNIFIATIASVLLTSMFSFAYYFLDKTFTLTCYKNRIGYEFPKKNTVSSKQFSGSSQNAAYKASENNSHYPNDKLPNEASSLGSLNSS